MREVSYTDLIPGRNYYVRYIDVDKNYQDRTNKYLAQGYINQHTSEAFVDVKKIYNDKVAVNDIRKIQTRSEKKVPYSHITGENEEYDNVMIEHRTDQQDMNYEQIYVKPVSFYFKSIAKAASTLRHNNPENKKKPNFRHTIPSSDTAGSLPYYEGMEIASDDYNNTRSNYITFYESTDDPLVSDTFGQIAQAVSTRNFNMFPQAEYTEHRNQQWGGPPRLCDDERTHEELIAVGGPIKKPKKKRVYATTELPDLTTRSARSMSATTELPELTTRSARSRSATKLGGRIKTRKRRRVLKS